MRKVLHFATLNIIKKNNVGIKTVFNQVKHMILSMGYRFSVTGTDLVGCRISMLDVSPLRMVEQAASNINLPEKDLL